MSSKLGMGGNGSEGAVGTVSDTELGNWNAKLALVGGGYQLTLKGLNLIGTGGGVWSCVPLTICLDGTENCIVPLSGTALDGTAALYVNGDLTVTAVSENARLSASSNVGNGIHVTGDFTIGGGTKEVDGITKKVGCFGIYAGGDFLAETGSGNVFGCCDGIYNRSSRGIKVAGNVVSNSTIFIANGGNGIGLEAGGSITLSGGYILLSGESQALNKEPDLSAHPAYIYSLGDSSTQRMPYQYNANHTSVEIHNAPYASIADVTISGTVGTTITPTDAVVTLTDEFFPAV